MEEIVLVNYTGRKGGGAAFAYEMTKGLIENEVKVAVIISKYIENIELWRMLDVFELYEIDTYNSNIEFILQTVKFLMYEHRKLRQVFSKYKIKAIYCPMIQPWTHIINNIFKNTINIITVHDPEPHSGSNKIINYLGNCSIKKADKIIILSEVFKEFTANKFNKKLKDIYVIPHGNFKYYREQTVKREKDTYRADHINYVFFGRISKYKGLQVLAEAYRIVEKELTNVTLTVAGSGDFHEFSTYYNGLKNFNLKNRWFKDNEVGSLFEGNNIICVLPYIDATQSGVIPIAMDYKVPIIASRTGGLEEQLENGKLGALVIPNNAKELAKEMIKMAKDYEYRMKYVEPAYQRVQELSWNVLAKKLKIIIEDEGEVDNI